MYNMVYAINEYLNFDCNLTNIINTIFRDTLYKIVYGTICIYPSTVASPSLLHAVVYLKKFISARGNYSNWHYMYI